MGSTTSSPSASPSRPVNTTPTGSPSEQARKDANKWYGSHKVDGLSPTIKLERLKKALLGYEYAQKISVEHTDRLRATKNIAVANRDIAKLLYAQSLDSKHVDKIALFYGVQALQQLSKIPLGFKKAEEQMGTDWVMQIAELMKSVYEEYIDYTRNLDLTMEKRCHLLRELCENGSLAPDIHCRARLECGELYLKWGISELEGGMDGDVCNKEKCMFAKWCFEEAPNHLRFSESMIHKCYAQHDDVWLTTIQEQLVGNFESLKLQHVLAESRLKRSQGKGLLLEGVEEGEGLNMDLVWEGIDTIRHAFIISKQGGDIEGQCIASSFLGQAFGDILKMAAVSEHLYLQSITLAMTLSPRTFYSCRWHQLAIDEVEKYRKSRFNSSEDVVDDETKKKIKPFVETMDKCLNEVPVEVKKKRAYVLLKLLYTDDAFKPKSGKTVDYESIEDWSEVTKEKVQKLILKAISHYHPDRNLSRDHGFEWNALAVAITKRLNVIYGRLKE